MGRFTSSPRFSEYQSFIFSGFSEKKKIPPIPVAFGVVSWFESISSDCPFYFDKFFDLLVVRSHPVSVAKIVIAIINFLISCFLSELRI